MSVEETDLSTAELFLLWAARETGALTVLADDADTPAEVVERTGITEEAADLVVAALADLGFLARVDDAYEPTNRMLGFLASADLRSVGRVPDALDAVDALVALPETMRTGDTPDSDDRIHRLGARAALDDATVHAVATAAVREAPSAERALVVRGAPGQFARELADCGLDVTLADRPAAVEAATPLLASTAVDPVAVEPGEPLPGGFDLVFAADVTRQNDPVENRQFVTLAADALAPGGALALADVVWGRSGRAVPAAVEALAREGSSAYRETDFAAWFEAAGLGKPAFRDAPGTDRQVVVGRAAGSEPPDN
jgi:hypothetical protein